MTKLWYNEQTGELQSEKPGATIVDTALWTETYGKHWKQVPVNFIPPVNVNLELLKEQAWQTIKTKRDQLEQTGAPYLGKILDSDEKSVTRISIAVQAAQAAISAGNADFTLNWTMQDNTVLTMTAQQVCGMAVALAQHSDGLHKIARDLRAKIEAATSAEELDTIKWPE